jgi:hypothetical protein
MFCWRAGPRVDGSGFQTGNLALCAAPILPAVQALFAPATCKPRPHLQFNLCRQHRYTVLYGGIGACALYLRPSCSPLAGVESPLANPVVGSKQLGLNGVYSTVRLCQRLAHQSRVN